MSVKPNNLAGACTCAQRNPECEHRYCQCHDTHCACWAINDDDEQTDALAAFDDGPPRGIGNDGNTHSDPYCAAIAPIGSPEAQYGELCDMCATNQPMGINDCCWINAPCPEHENASKQTIADHYHRKPEGRNK